MVRQIISTCAVLSLSFVAAPQTGVFSKFPKVEAYEVRPGILMMPKYTINHQVCEVTLQKLLYTNGSAKLNSTLPHEEIVQIADEVAPPNERGPLTMDWGGREYMSAYAGGSVTTFAEYQNLSIQIFGNASSVRAENEIVAVIQWKNRTCG